MKLLPQQIKASRHLDGWKVGALFMEAGTGKTRVACELINNTKDIDMVLWVGPLLYYSPKIRPVVKSRSLLHLHLK